MRLLVIEDEERLAEALRRGLTAAGYAVDVEHDGPAGLWAATERRYAAILLDIMLPGLNGYRVCARLRERGVDTPILMLTAKNGEYDEAEALDTGADDYLAKPFSYVVLEARLRALLRRGGPARDGRVLRVGDLWLDRVARSCGRDEARIELTAKEFAVLECLAQRPDEVVPKVEIVDQVWDANYAGDLNIVEVYVSSLRRKIDAPFGRESISTVRGVGYKLVGRADRIVA
ncbi:response regulator transcription factor [Kitasatospora sp. NPDC096147]|uniref:response regulator transcription factor n=1 Tax=Kitasatospora sp. NPDC096147 TaxID=3364093 RepID=UPI0038118ACF